MTNETRSEISLDVSAATHLQRVDNRWTLLDGQCVVSCLTLTLAAMAGIR